MHWDIVKPNIFIVRKIAFIISNCDFAAYKIDEVRDCALQICRSGDCSEMLFFERQSSLLKDGSIEIRDGVAADLIKRDVLKFSNNAVAPANPTVA